jgi:hypothetical protein
MARASTKASKGKATAASKKSKPKKDAARERKETYVDCPYTDQKVWISKATLNDLKPKKGGKNSSVSSDGKKRLWTIASSQIRQAHYVDIAQGLSTYEQALLPSLGGRSWEVSVKLSEPNARVLFRSWKGQMEVCMWLLPCRNNVAVDAVEFVNSFCVSHFSSNVVFIYFSVHLPMI